MKRIYTLLLLFCSAIHVFGEVGDLFSRNGIQYQVIKENPAAQSFEVNAVHYDSAYIILPDSVSNGIQTYAVTDAIQWYNPQNCALRHYLKIDMSKAKHITSLISQRSGLIAIDTLILPPNLARFPNWFNTTDSLRGNISLMDTENLLPGVHRIWSTGTQALEDIQLKSCTSLLEADLSSYTTTFANSIHYAFCCNPFLERLVIPNTITAFYAEMFYGDIRLTDLNIPDSLVAIYNPFAEELAMDTLRLGSKVSYIFCGFAGGWYNLRHIEVDTANTSFMSDNGVLYTKDQLTLLRYPFTRDGYSYEMSPNTESLCGGAFANGWESGYISDVIDFNWDVKANADATPLKELVCSPRLMDLGNTGTFYGSSIRKIRRFAENNVREIPTCCFMTAAIDSIALPFGLTDIGIQAFAFTYNLRTISNLSRLRNLRSIGEGAFRDAWKLEKIDLLPCNQLKEIPPLMCFNDSSLQFVSLPRNVQSIGEQAFKNCGALQQIICPALIPISIDPSVFEGVDKQNCVLKVPARSLSLYKNAPVWEEFFHIDTDGFYYIETHVSDTAAGSVTGGGAYLQGDYATITADAKPGYRFVSWTDGYTYSTRIFQVTQNETFTAVFEEIPPTFYTLTVQANNDNWGEVTGSGQYEAGTEVTLTATPYEGYFLRYWSFTDLADETILYTMPPVSMTLIAYFMPREESLESIKQPAPSASKILLDGHILILRGDRTYTLTGQEVK